MFEYMHILSSTLHRSDSCHCAWW